MNPQIPTGYATVWVIIAVALAILAVAALFSLSRHSQRLSGLTFALWVLAILMLPVAGSATWFIVGRSHARRLGTSCSSGRD